MFEIVALMLISQQPIEPYAAGVASYYTVASSSTLTASGETFSDDGLTCAMLDGTFGDYFLVVAEETGKSVVVKLNDRGPYVDGRIIDLSEAAMRELCPTSGLLNVSIFRLGPNPPRGPSLN